MHHMFWSHFHFQNEHYLFRFHESTLQGFYEMTTKQTHIFCILLCFVFFVSFLLFFFVFFARSAFIFVYICTMVRLFSISSALVTFISFYALRSSLTFSLPYCCFLSFCVCVRVGGRLRCFHWMSNSNSVIPILNRFRHARAYGIHINCHWYLNVSSLWFSYRTIWLTYRSKVNLCCLTWCF